MSRRTEDDLPITGSEISIAVRVGAAVRRLFGRPQPGAILRRRKEVKDELRKHIPETRAVGEYVEILIVNHRKPDRAGEPDERLFQRGASDSSKAEVRGLGDRCLDFYGGLHYARVRDGKAYIVQSEEPNAIEVWLVGKIPYERIEYIDWEPDPTAGAPRFYVRFGLRRNPCRGGLDLYLADDGEYPRQLFDVKWKGRGGGPIKRVGRFVSDTILNYKLRRMNRRWRQEQAERFFN